MDTISKKRVLNAGSGPALPARLREFFAAIEYDEVRLDIDPAVKPDLVGTFSQIGGIVADASFDALWSSHSLEHLHEHEALEALCEFRRILRPDGFAIVNCPDIAAAGRLLATHDVEAVVYESSAGPIRVLDILYGHAPSISAGRLHMAHRTGFTASRLGRLAAAAGCAETRVIEGEGFDLWAAMLMPKTDAPALARQFAGTQIAALFPESDARSDSDEAEPAPKSRVKRRLNPAGPAPQRASARLMASSFRPSGSP